MIAAMPLFSLGERRVRAASASITSSPTTRRSSATSSLHNNANVWFQVVIRAENDRITIGEGCNIQDGSVLHVDPGLSDDARARA